MRHFRVITCQFVVSCLLNPIMAVECSIQIAATNCASSADGRMDEREVSWSALSSCNQTIESFSNRTIEQWRDRRAQLVRRTRKQAGAPSACMPYPGVWDAMFGADTSLAVRNA